MTIIIIITSLTFAIILPVYAETMIIRIPTGASASECDKTNECYIPYETKIVNGSKITWSNDDYVAHTVTSGNVKEEGSDDIFDSGLLMSGRTFSHVFEKVDTFDYFCTIHPWMKGIIIVESPTVVVEEESKVEKTTTENKVKISEKEVKEEKKTYENRTKSTKEAKNKIPKFMMNVDENKIALDYTITDGSQLQNIHPDMESNSLVITLNATKDGSLAIILPRNVIDATINGKDDEFFVLVDEEEVDFDEIVTPVNRTLTIKFLDNTDEIEIIGSFVIPEFGTIAAMILAVAVISIIAISAKSRL